MKQPLPSTDLNFILSHTEAFWSYFQGSRLFITGATGFIGTWLIGTFLKANEVYGSQIEIIALSRSPENALRTAPHLFLNKGVKLIQGDVRNFNVDIGSFDLCIHAATDVGDPVKITNGIEVFDVCVQGVHKLFEKAAISGTKYFLLTSSGAVYGKQANSTSHMPETCMFGPDVLDIRSAYGEGKRAAEFLSYSYANQLGIKLGIARIYSLIGPNLPLNGPFAAGNFLSDALNNNPIQIKGDGRTIRSYFYIADAIIWLLRILLSGKDGQAYNLGSENAISIKNLAEQILNTCNKSLKINIQSSADVSVPVSRYVPDTRKAKTELGLKEYTSLDMAIRKTYDWNYGELN